MNNLDYTQTGNTNIDAINKNRATLVSSGFDPYTGAAQPNITPSPLPANISTDTVGSGTSPVNIPSPTPTPTTANALDASSATSITQAHNALQTELQGQKDTAQTSLDTTTGKLQSLFGDKTQILNDKITAMQTPEFLAKQKATVDAQNQLDQQNQAQLAETNATNQNGALTNDQKTLAIGAINNKYAFGKANLSLSLDIANRNYTSAEDQINKVAQLKMEALQPQIDYYSSFLSSNEANLSKSEQNILQQKIDEFKTAQTQAGELTKQIGTLQISAGQNGAPASVVQAIGKATTLADAVTAAGSYGVDALKQLQITKAKLDIQKVAQDITNGQPATGEYADIINGAGNLVGSTKGQTTKTAIASALAGGNYATAYAQIANNVEESLTGTAKTTFADARTDIGVMAGLRDAIQAYASTPGANLGYLKGNADTIAKNFGQLVTDPRFTALGTELQREFQAYRLQMTGAAFSPEESKDYASVNPRTNASLDLNLATIDGALSQLENRVTSTVETRLPGSTKIYNLATGGTKNADTSDNLPVGDVQVVGTTKYVKASDGKYYPQDNSVVQSAQSNSSSTKSLLPDFSNYKSGFNSFIK